MKGRHVGGRARSCTCAMLLSRSNLSILIIYHYSYSLYHLLLFEMRSCILLLSRFEIPNGERGVFGAWHVICHYDIQSIAMQSSSDVSTTSDVTYTIMYIVVYSLG